MSLWLLTIAVILIDQISKFFVVKYLYQRQIDIIPNIFSLTYVENYGTAWGLFASFNAVIRVILPIVIIGLLMYFSYTSKKKSDIVFSTFILGGAIGNYMDRILRGYVVDFLDFKVWPVFNFADVMIVIGCILMCIGLFRKEEEDGD